MLFFFRDSVLLKAGNWTKKIDVKRAFNSEDLSVNLISSEYGKFIEVMNPINIKNMIAFKNFFHAETEKQFK